MITNCRFERETDSAFPRNLKQVQNYKSLYVKTQERDDIISNISVLLDQRSNSSRDPSDDDQSFLQEILFRNGKQPSYVLYTEQSLKDIERFGTNSSAPTSFRSVLAVDTTFNISSSYFTQTTYRNLSLIRKDKLKASGIYTIFSYQPFYTSCCVFSI